MGNFSCKLPDGREYDVDYDVLSHGSPQGDYCDHGPGDPAEPPELEIVAIFDARGREYVEQDSWWRDLVNIFKGKRILSSKDMEHITEKMYEQHVDDYDDYYDPEEWHDWN